MAQRGWLQLGHIFNPAYDSQAIVPNGFDRAVSQNANATKNCDEDISKVGLAAWASESCPYPYEIKTGNHGCIDDDEDSIGCLDGDFIAGMTGEMANALDVIASEWTGRTGYAPIFDYVYEGTCKDPVNCMANIFDDGTYDPINCTGGCMPEVGWWSGSSKYYYHIVGFVGFHIDNVDHPSKSIYASFKSAVIQANAINPGYGIDSSVCSGANLVGVMLWE
jgi:hypothetical protein